jgi:hypothetical protein
MIIIRHGVWTSSAHLLLLSSRNRQASLKGHKEKETQTQKRGEETPHTRREERCVRVLESRRVANAKKTTPRYFFFFSSATTFPQLLHHHPRLWFTRSQPSILKIEGPKSSSLLGLWLSSEIPSHRAQGPHPIQGGFFSSCPFLAERGSGGAAKPTWDQERKNCRVKPVGGCFMEIRDPEPGAEGVLNFFKTWVCGLKA